LSREKEDSFAAMFEREAPAMKRARTPRVGDRVEGIVVQLGRDSVSVELCLDPASPQTGSPPSTIRS